MRTGRKKIGARSGEARKPPGKLPCGRPWPAGAPHDAGAALAQYESRLERYVSAQGLNRSSARAAILSVAIGLGRHFTASDLVRAVHEKLPSLGAATVYRNLPVLVGAGTLRESLLDEQGQVVYELESPSHHDHIVCLDCRAILEFHDSAIEEGQDKVMRKMRFQQLRHRHVIYARCEYAKKNG